MTISIATCLMILAQGAPAPVPPSKIVDPMVEVRGRCIDEDYLPYVESRMRMGVTTSCGSNSDTKSTDVQTDAQGRFTMQVIRRPDKGCERWLSPEPRDRPGEPRAPRPTMRILLPATIDGPVLDLGDLRLALVGSPRRCEHMSEDELEGTVRDAMRRRWFYGGYRWNESVLLEMVRRGDERYAQFLQAELTAWTARLPEPDAFDDDRGLFLLTALRRLQHLPDPLAMWITTDQPIVALYPRAPVFEVQLVNSDERGASFTMAEGGGYRSGRLERWRVDVRTLEGAPVVPFDWRGGMGGGLFQYRRLAPGESIGAQIELENYVASPLPGIYEARIHHHDDASIANDADMGNLIVTTSAWTRFEIQPRTVRITKAEDARARRAVADAVVPESIVVYWTIYDPEVPFEGEARGSEAVLFAMGWKSVPALIAELDEKDLSVRKRAWVLAQLYNLTGLNDPSAQGGIMGKHEHTPGPLETGSTAGRAFVTGWSSDGPIDEPKQRAFADQWKQSSRGFRFEIVD